MKINHIDGIKVFLDSATFEIGSLVIYVNPNLGLEFIVLLCFFCL